MAKMQQDPRPRARSEETFTDEHNSANRGRSSLQQHMKRSHAEAGQSQVAVTDVGMSDASDRSLLATPVIPGSSVPVKDRPTLPDGNPAVEQWHRCRRTGCEGTFMKRRNRNSHERNAELHGGQLFGCGWEECSREFQTSTELINHQRTHTDHLFLWHQRGCCKNYASWDLLKRHLRKEHTQSWRLQLAGARAVDGTMGLTKSSGRKAPAGLLDLDAQTAQHQRDKQSTRSTPQRAFERGIHVERQSAPQNAANNQQASQQGADVDPVETPPDPVRNSLPSSGTRPAVNTCILAFQRDFPLLCDLLGPDKLTPNNIASSLRQIGEQARKVVAFAICALGRRSLEAHNASSMGAQKRRAHWHHVCNEAASALEGDTTRGLPHIHACILIAVCFALEGFLSQSEDYVAKAKEELIQYSYASLEKSSYRVALQICVNDGDLLGLIARSQSAN